MDKEIKVGDKVRVSKDIPQFYRRYSSYRIFEVEHQVVDIEDGLALLDSIPSKYVTTIPCKYLVKVDAEAKEPKFKIGDRVEEFLTGKSGIVLGIEGDIVVVGVPYDKEKHYWHIDSVELVGPTEQTEAEEDARIRQMETELDEFRKAELDRVLHPEKPTFEVTIDNMAMNWQRYEADLAKEVALKITNKHMDGKPEEIGEYAVRVAKAVVEGLKRK